MGPWLILIVAAMVILPLTVLGAVRQAARAAVLRHPVAAARSFLSVSIALFLGWFFNVPIDWVLTDNLCPWSQL